MAKLVHFDSPITVVGYYSTSYKLVKANYVTEIIKTKIYTEILIKNL